MASLCEVCSLEPSKYRCPVCRASSCSLACSKSHKLKCTPPQPFQETDNTSDSSKLATITEQNGQEPPDGAAQKQSEPNDFSVLERSPQLQELFTQFPSLRARLREIYKSTLEEEWVATPETRHTRGYHRGRGSRSSRGRGATTRGSWTPRGGFNRGLGRVRKWRDALEDGASGVDNEAFFRFASLVLGEDDALKQDKPPAG